MKTKPPFDTCFEFNLFEEKRQQDDLLDRYFKTEFKKEVEEDARGF